MFAALRTYICRQFRDQKPYKIRGGLDLKIQSLDLKAILPINISAIGLCVCNWIVNDSSYMTLIRSNDQKSVTPKLHQSRLHTTRVYVGFCTCVKANVRARARGLSFCTTCGVS